MSDRQDYEDERMRNIRLREGWVECKECKEIVHPESEDASKISDNGLCVGCHHEKIEREMQCASD